MGIALGHALISVFDNSAQKLIGYLAPAVRIESVTMTMKDNPALFPCILVDPDSIKRGIEAAQHDLMCYGEVPPLAVEKQIAGILVLAFLDHPLQSYQCTRG